jgi:UrcA family protein
MNTQSVLSGRLGSRHAASGAAILLALSGIASVDTIADQSAVTTTVSSAADVSLSDLNLSTAEGMRLVRDRLHAMAERVCADRGGERDPSSQQAFGACVDSTVANALRQIDALRQTHRTVRNSVTHGATVSLADLDLSTLEGARIARERLEAMARRLCGELARRQDLSYQPNYPACVHDSLAAALAQADAFAAARSARTAQRSAP